MSHDDGLFGYRLRLFTLAEELGNVTEACRQMGVSRQTYYRLKYQLERFGLEARPRDVLVGDTAGNPRRSRLSRSRRRRRALPRALVRRALGESRDVLFQRLRQHLVEARAHGE